MNPSSLTGALTLVEHTVYFFDGFQLDVTRRKLVSSGGVVLPIHSRAMDALLLLVANAGQLIEKRRLMQTIWPDAVVEDNNLSQCIVAIRKALGETAGSNRFVMTVPGRGYSFVCPVSIADRESHIEPAPATPRRSLKTPLLAGALLAAAVGALILLLTRSTAQPIEVGATTGRDYTPPVIILRLHETVVADDLRPAARATAALMHCLAQRPGSRLRVRLQLVAEGANTPLWSGQYVAAPEDILNLQLEPGHSIDAGSCRSGRGRGAAGRH